MPPRLGDYGARNRSFPLVMISQVDFNRQDCIYSIEGLCTRMEWCAIKFASLHRQRTTSERWPMHRTRNRPSRAMTTVLQLQQIDELRRYFLPIIPLAAFCLLLPPAHLPPSPSTHLQWLLLCDCRAPSAPPLPCGPLPSMASAATPPARPRYAPSILAAAALANSARCSR